MTKKELFEKYNINESHSEWNNQIDDWMSVEVYRIMHNGELPPPDDNSVLWVCDFLDKCKDVKSMMEIRKSRNPDDFGSLYLTSKRMIYSFSEQILRDYEPKK